MFEKYRADAYPHVYDGTLKVTTLMGGTPSDPNVAEGWLRKNLGMKTDELIQSMVAEIMVERGIGMEEALQEANNRKNLNGFKRTAEGALFIEGRQLKAALKEAVNVAIAAGKISQRGWGKTNKGLNGFFPEHAFVLEQRLLLAGADGKVITEPTGINQRFVHTWRGNAIQYEEYVDGPEIIFTVGADHLFSEKEWATIWLTGEKQGIGSSRSQGYGVYEITDWSLRK